MHRLTGAPLYVTPLRRRTLFPDCAKQDRRRGLKVALFEMKYMKRAVLSSTNSEVEDGATLFLLCAVSKRPIERLKDLVLVRIG